MPALWRNRLSSVSRRSVIGLGALISEATAKGDFGLLTAATLTMIVVVVTINRYFWRRLYRLAAERYTME